MPIKYVIQTLAEITRGEKKIRLPNILKPKSDKQQLAATEKEARLQRLIVIARKIGKEDVMFIEKIMKDDPFSGIELQKALWEEEAMIKFKDGKEPKDIIMPDQLGITKLRTLFKKFKLLNNPVL
jgi:hypothetical protein